jgi:glyoxylase-like metal-dependent hydrolase (beta-lactamase superfamily II)
MLEVRCFVVAGPEGVVLVDAGPPGSSTSIGRAISSLSAGWSDVTDIVLTHRHFDHTGGLQEAANLALGARLWAGADEVSSIPFEGPRDIRPLTNGQQVGTLRVRATPGHTPGHVSLLHEDSAALVIGDVVGSMDGALTFGPPAFMTDPARNVLSLRGMLDLNPRRILFSHGEEVSDLGRAVRALLDRT